MTCNALDDDDELYPVSFVESPPAFLYNIYSGVSRLYTGLYILSSEVLDCSKLNIFSW